MPICPVCKEELTEKTDEGWKCTCGEVIHPKHAVEPRKSCGCGAVHGHN
jgi:hypothetical protein